MASRASSQALGQGLEQAAVTLAVAELEADQGKLGGGQRGITAFQGLEIYQRETFLKLLSVVPGALAYGEQAEVAAVGVEQVAEPLGQGWGGGAGLQQAQALARGQGVDYAGQGFAQGLGDGLPTGGAG